MAGGDRTQARRKATTAPRTWTSGGVGEHTLPCQPSSPKRSPDPESRAVPEVTVTARGTAQKCLDIR